MPDFELRHRGRRVTQFVADVNPEDEEACVELLERIADEQRINPKQAVLRTWVGRHRYQRDYRT
jgi:hypothetical protein